MYPDHADTGTNREIRIVGSGNVIGASNGTLQMYFAGTWGAVVAYGWDYHNARAACRQLGWETGAAVTTSGAVYGNVIGPVWPTQFECGWEERQLSECPKYYDLNDDIWVYADDARSYNSTAGVICRNGEYGCSLQLCPTYRVLHNGDGCAILNCYADTRATKCIRSTISHK